MDNATNSTDLREALQAVTAEAAPCDNCRHAPLCASTGDECPAFRLYAVGVSFERWKLAPRQPEPNRTSKLFHAY